MKVLVADIETNSKWDKIWCCVTRDITTGEVICHTEPETLKTLISKYDKIVGHSLISFDCYHLNRLWKTNILPSQVEDTLVMSRLLNPSIEGGHSLSAWGSRLGFPKTEYKRIWSWITGQNTFTDKKHVGYNGYYDGMEFDKPSIPLLESYCEQDTLVTRQLYNHLVTELKQQKFDQRSIDLEHKVQAIIAKQERNGFKLDERKATILLSELQGKLNVIEVSLQSIFPTKTTERISEKTGKKLSPKVEVFNPGSRKQIGERLIEKGWKPERFTEKGNQPIVDEGTLEGVNIPEAKAIAEYLMIQKRVAQIDSWLKALGSDGRVHGKVITCGAITCRATHMSPNMAQIPASKKPYGHECRSLWTVDKGNVLVGCDLSGIELRCFAHYLNDKEYINEVVYGDVHTRNQQAFGVATRDIAKTVLYASLYGASAAKVGSIVGLGATGGKKILANFSDSVPAYKQLIEKVERIAAKGRLPGLCGYRLTSRSSHSALNTLLQSAGAIVAKQWIVEFSKELFKQKIPYKLVGWIHDEVQIETPEQYGDIVGKIVVESAKKAGEVLEFRVPVGAEYKIALNWGGTH